jgi:hypothetical protein
VSENEVRQFFVSCEKVAKISVQYGAYKKHIDDIVQCVREDRFDDAFKLVESVRHASMDSTEKRLVSVLDVYRYRYIDVNRMVDDYKKYRGVYGQMDMSDDRCGESIRGIERMIEEYIDSVSIYDDGYVQDILDRYSNDKQVLYDRSVDMYSRHMHRYSLLMLYSIIRHDIGWNDRKAYRLYVEVLNSPTIDKSVCIEYRKKLSSIVS